MVNHFRYGRPGNMPLSGFTQEALVNSLKHAQARRFEVQLHFESSGLTLLLQDDGLGFSKVSSSAQPVSVTSSGLGILRMKEQAGWLGADLAIESQAGKGITIRVVVPASARR